MKVDGVFAGGGMKALAFVGALEVLTEKNIHFERAAGTSAGALTAAFIKAGYHAEDIYELFSDLDTKHFLDPRPLGTIFPLLKWLSLYNRMGLYKGHTFEKWLEDVLAAKRIKTFNDLPDGCLKMVASDMTYGRFIVLPDDLPRYGHSVEQFSVAKAIRMSCSLPFFFEPVRLKNDKGEDSIIVDGGVLSNFPLWIFMRKEKKRERPILGLRLSPEYEEIPPRTIKNSLSLLFSMFDTMRSAHDQRYVAKGDAKNIVFIPVEGAGVTNFEMDKMEKKQLVNLGRETTAAFLKSWSY
ncbi:patatin-like phospholipase family protein [Salipaludibacillus sp. LMS25]|jgi:NTE family protein|uniref:patatin-like phospholipase family protein n=1 Tax=Salipaludibacillus sp. LMS25 TaxID=2924031 RepID=UPI0020D09072|nr:patatin-like phospholipase family protein [Salipaludibacillus sp. LMS25]UTR14471.1 patatin-like phospholipase family protein [Salipaludibacillus sp. LMS25]